MVRQRLMYRMLGAVLFSWAPIGLALRLVCSRSCGLSKRRAARPATNDLGECARFGASFAAAAALGGYLFGRQADRLAALSETDALTGLHNARGFSKRLHEEVARAN